VYKESWIAQYFSYEVKVDLGVVYFYNTMKRRNAQSNRFDVWLKIDNLAKLYFNTPSWWQSSFPEHPEGMPMWVLASSLSDIPHGFQSLNAPGTKAHLFMQPFFIVYKTVGSESNFLSFNDYYKHNLEKSILAMLIYDEEHNKLEPQFTPELILPYSNVLSLNNFLEFKMIDAKGNDIIVSDSSQLFILLTVL